MINKQRYQNISQYALLPTNKQELEYLVTKFKELVNEEYIRSYIDKEVWKIG